MTAIPGKLIAAVFVVSSVSGEECSVCLSGKSTVCPGTGDLRRCNLLLMSPVYNWCYNTVVYVHDDDKKKEDEEKKIAPKKRFKSESFGNFL